MTGPLAYVRLRPPVEDGAAIVDPDWHEWDRVLAENRRQLAEQSFWLLGTPAVKLRRDVRVEMIAEACAYTRAYRDASRDDVPADTAAIVMSGHQPQLFHPGVWFKNFALDHARRRWHATAVHLLIDQDLCREVALRMPGGTASEPYLATVAYDLPGPPVVYECRAVRDREVFRNFPLRVRDTIARLVANPLVTDLWPDAVAETAEGVPVGIAISRARHRYETRCGLDTLELPISRVCRLTAFYWFVAHLAVHAQAFRQVHNQCLRVYRRVHGIRSEAHPVPALTARDDWVETPFWLWTDAEPVRRPLLIQLQGSALRLGDGSGRVWQLQHEGTADGRRLVQQLMDLSEQGVRIRPRALTTTLFARLFLCDLFLHGIGGAKYDQLTDQIIEAFFGTRPPRYVTLSATLRLPIARPAVRPADLTEIEVMLRQMWYQPERFVDIENSPDSEAAEWAEMKGALVNVHADLVGRAQRHRLIDQANAQLRRVLAGKREALRTRRESVVAQLRAAGILASREYSFCLFPHDRVVPRLEALLPAVPSASGETLPDGHSFG